MNSRVLSRVYISAYIIPLVLFFACIYHAIIINSENSLSHLFERILFVISISTIVNFVLYYSKYLYFKLLNTFIIISIYAFVITFAYQYYSLGNFNLLEVNYLANFFIIIILIYDKRK